MKLLAYKNFVPFLAHPVYHGSSYGKRRPRSDSVIGSYTQQLGMLMPPHNCITASKKKSWYILHVSSILRRNLQKYSA